ncbi:MAG: S1 RNA-binding domain-containing protein [Candidatus Eisenbacteria bacterium]
MSEDRQPSETHEPETPKATEADAVAQPADDSAASPVAKTDAEEPKAGAPAEAKAEVDSPATTETPAATEAPAASVEAKADAPKADPPKATAEEEEEQIESRKRAEFGAMLDQFDSTKSVGDEVEVGTKVKGRVIQIGDDTSFIDFGGRSEGAVETQHLKADDGSMKYAVGDEIELFVVAATDQILLAPSVQLRADEALQTVREAKEKGVPISGKVASINAGGLEVHVGSLRAFCPFSQIELGYCNEPSAYLGQSLEFLVQDIGDGGKNLVVSRKALLRREEKAKAGKLLETLKEGSELDGRVARIQPFGAFVDIGGLEGLVHVSEIQYGHVSDPNEVLKVGQEVRVRVLRMDKDQKGRLRIGLSMKAAQPDPWTEIAEQYWQGKKTQGTVVRMQDFGAFVELTPGIDGLVHVSEIAHTPTKHPKDVLEVGQRVDVTVLNVDTERKRISLSIKDQLPRDAAADAGEGSAQGGGGRAARSSAPEKTPSVGDIVDGVVANIKPYGLFVDLPMYGPRTRGLCPREETGERRGTDLEKRFSSGTPVKVAVIEVQPDGKIRLSMKAVQDGEERASFESYRKSAAPAAAGNRGNTAMAEAFKKAMQKNN